MNTTSDIYWNFVHDLAPRYDTKKMRYMDVFQLTGTCYFDNCTSDGGHRARFVNRWKAQLLLNTICSYG